MDGLAQLHGDGVLAQSVSRGRFGAGGGDDVSVADWVQIGRFAAKLDTPVSGIEFQKADCAGDEANPPIGDGDVSVADWVKCGRYAAKLDAKLTAQGPTGL